MSERLVPDFKVKINGSPLDNKLFECLQWVEVDMSIKMLDMCTLSFDNPYGIIADRSEFDSGTPIAIEAGYIGEIETIFDGEIISLEPIFPAGGGPPSVIVRAYDKLHKYRRGKKTRTFANQKVSDVIKTLGGEDGLSIEVDTTSTTVPWMLQNNQSNIDYIKELARKSGFEVTVDELTKLRVKKPRHDKGEALTLKYHENLKSFYVRKDLNNVPTKVITHSWDMKQKKAVEEKHEALDGNLKPSTDVVAEAKKAFGDAELHITTRPQTDPAQAQAMSAAIINEEAMRAVRGRGTAVGEPKLIPGIVLLLDGLGKEWSGNYYVTGARHQLDRAAGYSSSFEVCRTGTGSSLEPRPLVDPVPPPPGQDDGETEQNSDIGAQVSRG